jgi:GNAT superfamily N-acetyltransferase
MLPTAASVAVSQPGQPVVCALDETDLADAARILRLAFGTFLGAPDPETFWTDRDYAYGRHGAAHVASFAAKIDGKLAGSSFATRWGSVGFFGPLSVHPDLQELGIGRALLDKAMRQFDPVGNSARRVVYLCTKRQARGPLSEIRFLCALPHRSHVGRGRAATRRGALLTFQHPERSATERGSAFVPRGNRNALPRS